MLVSGSVSGCQISTVWHPSGSQIQRFLEEMFVNLQNRCSDIYHSPTGQYDIYRNYRAHIKCIHPIDPGMIQLFLSIYNRTFLLSQGHFAIDPKHYRYASRPISCACQVSLGRLCLEDHGTPPTWCKPMKGVEIRSLSEFINQMPMCVCDV